MKYWMRQRVCAIEQAALKCGMRQFIIVTIICAAGMVRADQLQMQNGDRYNGKVVSMSATNVVFQSDVIGTMSLPRGKVASLDFGTVQTNPTPPKPLPLRMTGNSITNKAAGQLSQLSAQTNLIQQVQTKLLGDATPEANAKFNQMLNDLSTGKMSMGDLRKQAADAAEELRSDIKDMGDDTGILGTYLSTLDDFLNQSGGTSTNSPVKAVSNSSDTTKLDSLLDTN